jgi:hypothetical protein
MSQRKKKKQPLTTVQKWKQNQVQPIVTDSSSLSPGIRV